MQIKHMPVYYLASPYTHKKKSVMKQRFIDISKVAAILIKRGYLLVTPISSSVPIAQYGGLQGTDFSDWATLDLNLVKRCDGIIVAMMEGWKESVGVQAEIAYARHLGKEVRYLNVETMRFNKASAGEDDGQVSAN